MNVRTFERSNVFPGSLGAGAAIALALLVTGCGSSEPDCSLPETLCVGLVTATGGLHDHGLTQLAWDGIQRAQSDGLIQHAAYVESQAARDYVKNIDFFARQEYDVVVTAGAGLRDDTLQAADRYPDLVFAGLDQPPDDPAPNLVSITFQEDRGGFLAGALAAMLSETGVVGAACETSGIASNWRACEGFRAGARVQDPDVAVLVTYRDDGSQETLFRDTAWGQAAGLDLIRDGADVIFGVGGGTGKGALIAAAEADVYAIGSERDQFHVTREAQPVLLTSVLEDPGPALYELLRRLAAGDPYESHYVAGIGLAPFHALENVLAGPAEARLHELQRGLEQGTVFTGVDAEPPE